MREHDEFVRALEGALRGEVLADEHSRGLYATDASLYEMFPVAVALPRDEADVLAALRLAREYGVSVLARGGGTSLAGQTVGHSLVLDFSRHMNRLLEVNVEERWARVEPGLVRDELNRRLAQQGLHFAPDPATSSRANFGGMIANNSSGTRSIFYGKTVDHLLELKVALADGTVLHLGELSPEAYEARCRQNDREGEILRRFRELIRPNEEAIRQAFPKVMRRVQGYNLDEFAGRTNWNLAKLICGSEGTLALILEAKVRLEPLPAHKSLCVVHFRGLPEALRGVQPILEFGPSAVELLDEKVLAQARNNLLTRRLCGFLEGEPGAVLVVEFFADSEKEAAEKPARLAESLRSRGIGYAWPVITYPRRMEEVWTVRRKGLGLVLGMRGARKPLAFIEDAAVPVEHLPEYIEGVLNICRENDTDAVAYAHASVGVLHVRPILDLRRPEDLLRFRNISEATFRLVKKFGGSWSGEHGDGLSRSYYLERYFGSKVYGLLREVKRLFDPENLLNPGKIVDAPPIDRHLRYDPNYRETPPRSQYHFRNEGSFAEAVHLCSGVGECRKLKGGTMCPSFRATLDEEHSTRGRANLLRLAMAGRLPGGLTHPRLLEALDLCLSCKACKSECPSNVDMAKLKSEVWQLRYDRQGVPLRDRLVARSAALARTLAGPLAPVVNALQRSAPFRRLQESLIGLDRRRSLPAYAPRSFVSWFAGRPRPDFEPRGQVVLFADTYLNFHEPAIGRAAVLLLEACGFEVLVADVGCCQRPRLSHGFLRLAEKDGERTARALEPYLQQELPVLVCEPSCASALNDDLPDLIADAELAERLRKGVRPLEAFLLEAFHQGQLSSLPPLTRTRWHVHGHCHQKALFGTEPIRKLMEAAGAEFVREIPSGCCGMAGSFGYEREHFDLSVKIGEELLLPAVRALPPNEGLIACGFSCRHQIADLTGRQAVHWVQCFDL